MGTTPHVSSLNSVIASIASAHYSYISSKFTDVKGPIISLVDNIEDDILRIRQSNKNNDVPVNEERLPYYVISPKDITPQLHQPHLDKFKAIINKNTVNGTAQKLLFRLIDLKLKSKVYVTNYAQALKLLEYLYCTQTNAMQYSTVNPYINETLKGEITFPSSSTINKLTNLEDKGVIYSVETILATKAVITVDDEPTKLILTPTPTYHTANDF